MIMSRQKLPSSKSGFTLIEIMVVVTIISLLATLAISMLLRNRLTANEAVAITSCKTIINACHSYYVNTMPHSYPQQLSDLTGNPSYIDSKLASGDKSGYLYIYNSDDPETTFTLNANPKAYQKTGVRSFYADETGKITATDADGQAGPGDPAI